MPHPFRHTTCSGGACFSLPCPDYFSRQGAFLELETRPSSWGFCLARRAPGSQPLRHFFMADTLPRVQFGERSANLSKLPFLSLDGFDSTLMGLLFHRLCPPASIFAS